MRAWRRTSSMAQGQVAPPGLTIVSVLTDGTANAVVTFSDLVVWTSLPNTTLTLDGQPGDWSNTDGLTKVQWTDQGPINHHPEEPWSCPGPETELTPAIAPGLSGITT